jgi:hypothetical protein
VKDDKVLPLAGPAELEAKRPSATLLETLLELLQGWRPAFPQRRTWARAIALALGLLCGLGRRTLTAALGFFNRQQRDWSADYKLFKRSRWEPRALFAPVLQTAVGRYCPQHIVIGLDSHPAQTQRQKGQDRLLGPRSLEPALPS